MHLLLQKGLQTDQESRRELEMPGLLRQVRLAARIAMHELSATAGLANAS